MDLCIVNVKKLKLMNLRDKPLLEFELLGEQSNANGTIIRFFLLNKQHRVMLTQNADTLASSEEDIQIMMQMFTEAIRDREKWARKFYT